MGHWWNEAEDDAKFNFCGLFIKNRETHSGLSSEVRFNKGCVALIWASCPIPKSCHYLYSAFAVHYLYPVTLDESEHMLMQVKLRAERIMTTRRHLEVLSVLLQDIEI